MTTVLIKQRVSVSIDKKTVLSDQTNTVKETTQIIQKGNPFWQQCEEKKRLTIHRSNSTQNHNKFKININSTHTIVKTMYTC